MTTKQGEKVLIGWVVIILGFGLIMECSDSDATENFSFKGRVIGITDGDTIKVLDGTKTVKVRLYGIDCPEKGQPFGNVAKKFTSDFVGMKTVTINVVSSDRYGRYIAKVETNTGHDLGEGLLKTGLAWWYQRYALHDTRYYFLEKQARDNKIGLWIDSNPIPPWKWRHK